MGTYLYRNSPVRKQQWSWSEQALCAQTWRCSIVSTHPVRKSNWHLPTLENIHRRKAWETWGCRSQHAKEEKIKRKLYSKRHLEIPATHCGYLDSYRLQPNTVKIGDKRMSSTTSYLKVSVTLEDFLKISSFKNILNTTVETKYLQLKKIQQSVGVAKEKASHLSMAHRLQCFLK